MSSATAVAETPSRIEEIFVNQEYPSNGAFQVKLWVRNWRVAVTVDDRVPVEWYGSDYQ